MGEEETWGGPRGGEREPGYSHVGIVWGRPRVNADAVAIGVEITAYADFQEIFFFSRKNFFDRRRNMVFFLFCNIYCKFYYCRYVSAFYDFTDKGLSVKC